MPALSGAKFTVGDETRPCYVKGEKAIFHGWAKDTKLIDGEFHEFLFALVEFADGTVAEVVPTGIIFADGGEMKDFAYIPIGNLKRTRERKER